MPRIFATGSNLFQQFDATSVADITTFTELPVEAEAVLAVSWSQLCYLTPAGEVQVAGLPLVGKTRDLRGCQFLGQESFTATVLDGRISPLDDTIPHTRTTKYGALTMNGHGEILACDAHDDSILHLYSDLAHALDESQPSLEIRNPSGESITQIVAGAGHFLLLSANSLLSYGDDRFAQSGSSSSPTTNPQLHRIDFFDGLYPTLIAAGDSHSAVVTRDGSLYMFGSDAEGQCGGFGEPNLVTFLEDGVEDESLEVTAIACGASHTVIATKSGSLDKPGIFVAGSNTSGQLGMGAQERSLLFSRLPLFETQSLFSSKWSTVVVTG